MLRSDSREPYVLTNQTPGETFNKFLIVFHLIMYFYRFYGYTRVSVMKSKESLAGSVKSRDDISTQEHEAKLAEQKRKQQELITG